MRWSAAGGLLAAVSLVLLASTGTGYAASSPVAPGAPGAAATWVDQREVVDPSFLELVRLGVKPATDPAIVNTVKVVDEQLGVQTPNGEFWHRYNRDGYGEQPDGGPWNVGFPPAPLTSPLNSGWGSQATIGRIWPIFAGERGEYDLAAGLPAQASLAATATCCPSRSGAPSRPRAGQALPPGPEPSPPRPWRGLTRNTSASPGPSPPVILSNSHR